MPAMTTANDKIHKILTLAKTENQVH